MGAETGSDLILGHLQRRDCGELTASAAFLLSHTRSHSRNNRPLTSVLLLQSGAPRVHTSMGPRARRGAAHPFCLLPVRFGTYGRWMARSVKAVGNLEFVSAVHASSHSPPLLLFRLHARPAPSGSLLHRGLRRPNTSSSPAMRLPAGAAAMAVRSHSPKSIPYSPPSLRFHSSRSNARPPLLFLPESNPQSPSTLFFPVPNLSKRKPPPTAMPTGPARPQRSAVTQSPVAT
jgi:hypothetical protein